MRCTTTVRAALVATAAIAAAGVGAGPAAAQSTAEVTAGRGWIVVSVTTSGIDRPEWCRVDPYFGTPETLSLAVPPSGNLFVDEVPAGPHRVSVWCPNGGAGMHDVVVR